MNGRARLVLLGVAITASLSCSTGTNSDDRVRASQARVGIDRPPMLCTLQPWAGDGRPCGAASVVEQRITCGDLGMSGVVLSPADHGDGHRTATYRNDNGIESDVVDRRDWSVATTVKADGSTMTFDALVFIGAKRSFVARFSSPQFNVRDVAPTVGDIATVQLCGYKPGRAASLPPPEPDEGPFTVTCSGNGSTSPPGVTVHSKSEIQWAVKVTPPPANGALVAISAEVDGAVSLGNSFTKLANGQLSGGFANDYLRGRHGTLSLQFGYGGGSCAMYWNVIEDGSDRVANVGNRSW